MRVSLLGSLEDVVVPHEDAERDDSPYHNGEEGQPSETGVHVIYPLENDWVCLEEEVEDSVGDGKVEAGEENNGLAKNHMDWSH